MARLLHSVSRNWQLKLTALAVAFLLWLVVQGGKPYRYRMTHVPVRVANGDGEWVMSHSPLPPSVSIDFHGRFRDLLNLSSSGIAVVIPVADVRDTVATYSIQPGWIDFGTTRDDISVGAIRPDTVRVSFDRIATRLVVLQAPLSGDVSAGFTLAGPVIIDPAVVRVSGASRRIAQMDTLRLPAVDISALAAYDTTEIMIDTTGMGVTVSPRRIRVIVPVQKVVQ
jgi:YbbR domain-containing protein